jgi:hypothetical protein
VRFEVLKAVIMSMLFSWVVTLCGLVGRCQLFGQTYRPIFGAGDGDSVSPKRWNLPTSPQSAKTQNSNTDKNSLNDRV